MKLNYNHTRIAAYIGIFIQAIILNLPPVLFIIFKEDFGLDYEQLGSLTLINFVIQIGVDLLMIKLGNIISLRTQAVVANSFSVIGLLLLALLPKAMPGEPFAALVIAEVFMAVGAGLIEVGISPLVSALPSSGNKAEMPLLHSFYCWGHVATCLFSTLYLFIFNRDLWYILPLVWAIIPLANALMFMKVPVVPLVSEENRTPLRKILKSKAFLCGLLMMICAGASEQSVAQWVSLFAEEALHMPKLLGDLVALCGFALLMAMGRMLYGLFGAKLDLKKTLFVCGVGCFISYLGLTLIPNPAVSLVFCALCGIFVSLMWPGTLEVTTSAFPLGGVGMFSLMSVMGDIGCSVGPFAVGTVSGAGEAGGSLFELTSRLAEMLNISSEAASLHLGILFAALFPALLTLLALTYIALSSKEKKKLQAE